MTKHPDFYVFDALFELLPDGTLLNKVGRGSRAKAGAEAGMVSPHGYRVFRLCGLNYRTPRVVWLLTTGQWPTGVVDHVDGNTLNDRPENLRDVSYQMNSQNRHGAQANSSTGLRGVFPSGNKFVARGHDPVTRTPVGLGSFACPQEAFAAAEAYRKQHYAGYVSRENDLVQ